MLQTLNHFGIGTFEETPFAKTGVTFNCYFHPVRIESLLVIKIIDSEFVFKISIFGVS